MHGLDFTGDSFEDGGTVEVDFILQFEFLRAFDCHLQGISHDEDLGPERFYGEAFEV